MKNNLTLNGIPVRKMRWNGMKIHKTRLTGAPAFVDYAEGNTPVHAKATFAGVVTYMTPHMPILLLGGGHLLAGCECWWSFEDEGGKDMSVINNAIILDIDVSEPAKKAPPAIDPRCAKCSIERTCAAVQNKAISGDLMMSKYCRRFGHGFAQSCGHSSAEIRATDRRVKRYLQAARQAYRWYHLVLPALSGEAS